MKQTFEQLQLTPVQLNTNCTKLKVIPIDRKMITEKSEEEMVEKESVTHGMHKKAGNCAYKNGGKLNYLSGSLS